MSCDWLLLFMQLFVVRLIGISPSDLKSSSKRRYCTYDIHTHTHTHTHTNTHTHNTHTHTHTQGFNVEISPSERAMLAYFLAKLHRADPDIIVGHNLSSYALEVLQYRMATCKVPQWSRVGRIKRKDMPKVIVCVLVG